MESQNYSEMSLKELYQVYTDLDKEKFPNEATKIFEEILKKEKVKNADSLPILASLTDRFAAALVDGLISSLPLTIPMIIIFGFDGIKELYIKYGILYTLLILIAGQLVFFLVNGRLLYKYGQSIGKRFLEIKIVDLQGNVPELFRSYGLRYFVPSLFPLLPFLGGLISLTDILFIFRKDRRCMHDHLASTRVINCSNDYK